MKIKSFKEQLERRLSSEEIAEIEQAAELEHDILVTLQNDVSQALIKHMADKGIGFNDLVRKLGKSPTQVSKMIKGEANLTLATVAQIFALLNIKARIHY